MTVESIFAALDRQSHFERVAFFQALGVGILMHAFALAFIGMHKSVEFHEYATLAVMDFSDFDPLGGQGGDGGEPAEEIAREEPEPEPAPEPFVEPEPEPEPPPEDLTLLESLAEAAEPAPMLAPPPAPEDRPKPAERPRPKPAPPKPAQAGGQVGGQSDGIPGTPGIGGSGPGGTPGGAGTGNTDEMSAYKGKVRRRLERRKKYPGAAQNRGISGTATVSFVISKDGGVHSTTLVSSSGSSVLDDEAVALPPRCSPMPPLPKSFTGANLKLTVPIRFSVR